MPTDTQKLSDIKEWHLPNGSNVKQIQDQYAVQVKMQYQKEKGLYLRCSVLFCPANLNKSVDYFLKKMLLHWCYILF